MRRHAPIRHPKSPRLRVGKANLDLRFKRSAQAVEVEVLRMEGSVELIVEPG